MNSNSELSRFSHHIASRYYLLVLLVLTGELLCTSPALCGPIHDAARDGDLATVKTLVKADPSLVDNRDATGRTPLYWAARAGRKDVVAFLLGNNADPNVKDNTGSTPLFRAAYSGYIDVAEMLLAHGADVNIGGDDHGGFTPMDIAEREGHPDMVQLLQQHGGKMMHPRPTLPGSQSSAISAASTSPPGVPT